jgi:hypothetical protein
MNIQEIDRIINEIEICEEKQNVILPNLCIDKLNTYEYRVFCKSLHGRILPGYIYKFDQNGKLRKRNVDFPTFTIILIIISFTIPIYQSDLILANTSFLHFLFPSTLALSLILLGLYRTNKLLKRKTLANTK